MTPQSPESVASDSAQPQVLVVGHADRDRILDALTKEQPANDVLRDLLKLSD